MTRIDPRGARFNQGVIGAATLAAFVLEAPLALPVLAALLAIGALAGPQWNPLSVLWQRALVPALRLAPPLRRKDAAPVRFAQAIGLVFLAAASLALLALAQPLLGWTLALIVAALALLAAITDFCAGCQAYMLLGKLAAGIQRS